MAHSGGAVSIHHLIMPAALAAIPLNLNAQWQPWLRIAALLVSTSLGAAIAQAQDASWQTNPSSNIWDTAANWTPATVPSATAIFGASTVTALSFSDKATVSINSIQITTPAPTYSFNIQSAAALSINGVGITNNSTNTPTFSLSNDGRLFFYNSSTAANSNITAAVNSGVGFFNQSTAGSAKITLSGGDLFFNNASTAGNAQITNNFATHVFFGNLNTHDTASAGSATITNMPTGVTQFAGDSSAGNATIFNNGIRDTAQASAAFTQFFNSSSAKDAHITNSSGGITNFFDSATAGNAIITNNGITQFLGSSTAGTATIITNDGGTTSFHATSSGGQAALITNAGGEVDISNLQSPGTAFASIEGAGTYSLGSKSLTVGGNNLNTTVSGVIADGGGSGESGGSLIKVGTGTLTLSGTNTYTGGTTINAGTLTVNGSIASSSLTTVNNGATLIGTGTVGNTTVTGGTFAPGSGTPNSSMTVTGTLGFNATATYMVNVNPTTSSSATVSGAATLGGATVFASYATGTYIAKQYTILTAGSISGTFGTLTTATTLPANFSKALSYDATHAYLNLSLNFTPSSAPIFGVGLTTNQQNVANALTNYFNTTGGISTVYGTLNGNGLSQASGQPGASVVQPSIDAIGQFVNAVFDNGFGGNGAGQGGPISYADADAYAPKRQASRETKDAYAAVTPRDKLKLFEPRWGVWAAVYGGNNRVSGDAVVGTSTTMSRTFGTAVGANYRFTQDTLAGFAIGGAGNSFSLDGGLGSGKADMFNVAIHAKHNIGAAYVAGALTYSWQSTTTDRTVTIAGIDALHASFKAQALNARLESGWRYATSSGGATPYAALQSTAFYLPNYSETASLGSNQFALNYASTTTTTTRTELGVKFDKDMPVQSGVLTLKVKTAWTHDAGLDRGATATFQTLPGATFTVYGAQPSSNAVLASLGGEIKWQNAWSIDANAGGEFSRTTRGYTGKGTVRYAW